MPHLLSFIALLFIVNPLNGSVLFIEMTSHYSPARRAKTALTASVWTAFILIFFALTGKMLFEVLGFTLSAFQIAGGLLIFSAARGMTRAQTPLEKSTPKETAAAMDQDDVGIVPLAIPMLAGPGAISTIILHSGEVKHGALEIPMLILSVLLVSVTVYLILSQSSFLLKNVGPNTIKVITRLMGLVIMAIGIQFIMNGVTGFLLHLKEHPGTQSFGLF